MYNDYKRRQALGLDYFSRLERRIKRNQLKTAGLLLTLLAIAIVINISTTVTYEKINYTMPDVCELSVVECDNEKVKVSVTKYEWTGNRMANGEYPHIGAVAVSDRNIPLGSKIILDKQEYIVKDRTALWVHEKFGLTVDIYSTETEEEMLQFGRQEKHAIILYKDKQYYGTTQQKEKNTEILLSVRR